MNVFVSADPGLATTLQATAAKHGIAVELIDTIKLSATEPRATEPRALWLQQEQAGLQGFVETGEGQLQQDALFTLPVRIGAVLDWVEAQSRYVAPIALGDPAQGLQLEPLARRIVRPDQSSLLLTEKEVAIIARLSAHATAAQPLTREDLLTRIWGYSPEADTHTLETHIYRLRQKLEGAGITALLMTGEGGYYLART